MGDSPSCSTAGHGGPVFDLKKKSSTHQFDNFFVIIIIQTRNP